MKTTSTEAKRRRRSIRLQEYDYSQEGAYYVTVCTKQLAPLFRNERIRHIAVECWLRLPDHFPTVRLDEWILMPNHLHAVLFIECDTPAEGAPPARDSVEALSLRRGVQLNAPTTTSHHPAETFSAISPRRSTLSVILRTYKAAVTTRCRRKGYPEFAWQRNYYEHVIRNDLDLGRIRQYILANPSCGGDFGTAAFADQHVRGLTRGANGNDE